VAFCAPKLGTVQGVAIMAGSQCSSALPSTNRQVSPT
jgi:hypothetical protein